MDAIFFTYPKTQFEEANIHRELIKCFCGFKPEATASSLNNECQHSVIATGNWGCGICY